MIDPWFSREIAPFFSLFSLLAVTAALEPLARKGQHRGAIIGLFRAIAAFGAVVLLAGLVAAASGQPQYVVGALLLTGGLVAFTFTAGVRDMQRVYREAEFRKTIAADL